MTGKTKKTRLESLQETQGGEGTQLRKTRRKPEAAVDQMQGPEDSPVSPPPSVLLPSAESLGILANPESVEGMLKAGAYSNYLDTYAIALANSMESPAIAKALAPPPSAFSFGTMSYMPDPQAGGLISWPGIPPEAIQRLARTTIAPELIIATRITDVLRYAQRASHPWRPGWKVEMRQAAMKPTRGDLRDIREAEVFIANCNIEMGSTRARQRDAAGYRGFRGFLAAAVRDFLTYDAMAIWTDMDHLDRVKAWAPIPAGNIRLADPQVGYRGNPAHFAVLIDQGGSVKRAFTRDQLIWYVGHPRNDPDIAGYPWSRVDAGMRVIQSFEDAFELNANTFSKSSIPMGILLLKGMGFTTNELDLITRQMQNLKRGVSKSWGLPAMVVPDQSDVEFLNMSAAHGQDMLYRDHMNLTIAVFCILYQFPWRRLGYHASGQSQDSEVSMANRQSAPPAEEEDAGLITLLCDIESAINEYILWTRWPHLQLSFSGKAPREDAREFENKSLSRTWGERRAENDLPTLESLAPDEESKKVAKLLSMMPVDPGLVTAWGNLVTKSMGIVQPGDSNSGASTASPPFQASRDPAAAESHGAIAGVRRHSPRRASRAK